MKNNDEKISNFKATDNEMGFMIPLFTWVSSAFLEYVKFKEKENPKVLIIAAGWGAMVFKVLAESKTVHVTANDLSENHLKHIKSHVESKNRSRLSFLFGDILKWKPNKEEYDTVLIRNVIHFFSGDQVEHLFKLINESLKPTGRIFIVASSPYVGLLQRTKVLDNIENRKKQSEKWPGYIANFKDLVERELPNIATKLPKQLHVMYIETLKKALEDNGFTVQRIEYHKAPEIDNDNNKMVVLDGREYLCASAVSKNAPRSHFG